jgi:hypothetical protein
MKKLNLIAVFAPSSINNKDKSMIASICYRYDFNVIPFNSLAELNLPLSEKKQIGRMTEIICVQKNFNDNFNKEVIENKRSRTNDIFIHVVEHVNVKYYVVNDYNFFTSSFFEKYIYAKKSKLIENVFIFEDLDWKGLVYHFKSLNITLSGGSTVKRHVLSPVQINLSRFLIGSEGLIESHSLTKKSFKLNNIIHKKNLIDNFSKDKKIWLIREKIRFSPLVKQYNLICKLLYLYNKNFTSVINLIFDNLNNYTKIEESFNIMGSNQGVSAELISLNEENFINPLEKFDLKNHPFEKKI